jgi:hypothetical protein
MILVYIGDTGFLGLTQRNVERLCAGEPMCVELLKSAKQLVVVYGTTKPDVCHTIAKGTGVPFERTHLAAAAADPL